MLDLRFFGRLSVKETAEVLHLSPASVKCEWSTAKAWLYHEVSAMKPERWQQIKMLLQSALEREPDQRSAFLARVGAGDDRLRREASL